MPQRRGRGGSGLAARHRLRIAGEPIPARPQHALAHVLSPLRQSRHCPPMQGCGALPRIRLHDAAPRHLLLCCPRPQAPGHEPGTCTVFHCRPALLWRAPGPQTYFPWCVDQHSHCATFREQNTEAFGGIGWWPDNMPFCFCHIRLFNIILAPPVGSDVVSFGTHDKYLFVFVIFGYYILFSGSQTREPQSPFSDMTNTFLFLSYSDIKYYFWAARSGSPTVHLVTFSGP